MKRIIIFTFVALSMCLVIIVGLAVYWIRIPATKYLKPISVKDFDLPEEVSVPAVPDSGMSQSPRLLAQKRVEGISIPYEVHSKEGALMALMYVRSYYEIPDDAEFACVEDEDTGAGSRRSFKFLQLYKGVPVQNRFFEIDTISGTGEVQRIFGCYEPMDDFDLDVTVEASAYKARKNISLKFGQRVEKAQLMIFVYLRDTERALKPQLGWYFYVAGLEGSDHKIVYISAKDGSVLYSKAGMIS